VEHSLFLEQVRSSISFAQAESFIKAKIRFEKSVKYPYSSDIKDLVDNIEMHCSEKTKTNLLSKPAYHFMFKQIKEETINWALYNLAHSQELPLRRREESEESEEIQS
jgi:hypothetical protein